MQLLNKGAGAPQASVLFLAYGMEDYLAQSVRSILGQEGVILEIIFSDDCSPGRAHTIMKQMLQNHNGPHRIWLRQNPVRLGIDHLPNLADTASCDLMIVAHADDVAMPGRCHTLLKTAEKTGASVLSSNAVKIDAVGNKLGLLVENRSSGPVHPDEIARKGWQPCMLGATFAFKREICEKFPRLDSNRLPLGHDHVIPFRGALLNGMAYIDEPLLFYRRHEKQWSNVRSRSGNALALAEMHLGRDLSARMAMLKDLEHLSAGAGPEAIMHLKELDAILHSACMDLSRQYMDVRNELRRRGFRNDWMPSGPERISIPRIREWLVLKMAAVRKGFGRRVK